VIQPVSHSSWVISGLIHKPLVFITQHQHAERKSFLWHKADMAGIKEIINKISDDCLNKYSLSTPVDTLWSKCVFNGYLMYIPETSAPKLSNHG